MNKEIALAHLMEAKQELDEMITEIKQESDFDLDEYYGSFEHIYNHLNTAWNARKENDSRIEKCDEEDFYSWRSFPKDFDMGG